MGREECLFSDRVCPKSIASEPNRVSRSSRVSNYALSFGVFRFYATLIGCNSASSGPAPSANLALPLSTASISLISTSSRIPVVSLPPHTNIPTPFSHLATIHHRPKPPQAIMASRLAVRRLPTISTRCVSSRAGVPAVRSFSGVAARSPSSTLISAVSR